MGKSKKKDSSGSSSSKKGAPKCTCEHAFECMCGNRPERPSRGHKWDSETQAWGGKGHKQKGASGQIHSVAQAAKTTSLGKTQVAQWQRMPSQLLQEFCKRQKRAPAKFKNIEKGKGLHKYRCIVPDQKDDDKDLFFVPAHGVPNEEQSKEEAALLALLSLTPSLPHERKLPEPYKTTWLNAVAQKKKTVASKPAKTTGSATTFEKPTAAVNKTSKGAAQASTGLFMASSYSSNADKRKQQEAKRQVRNARIRRHEAVRMANQDHPVFMSAQIRKQIEGILRGDSTVLQDADADDAMDDDAAAGAEVDDCQVYVEMRLHGEGFTKRQARASYKELPKILKEDARADEGTWDKVYEECLQFLLVHLDEDQLPEGFDPRGRTLDVVVPVKVQSNSTGGATEADPVNENLVVMASQHGLSTREAVFVQRYADSEKIPLKEALWACFNTVAGVSLNSKVPSVSDTEKNAEILHDELEALDAIYSSECSVVSKDGWTTVSVAFEDGAMSLEVVVEDGVYPAVHPKSVLVSGDWISKQAGTSLHVEIIKFASSLELGEPMIFEVHGQVQSILQSILDGELPSVTLLPSHSPKVQPQVTRKLDSKKVEPQGRKGRPRAPPVIRRPRERQPFWSTHPTKTTVATAFPKIPFLIDKTRKSLPAATARSEFLAVMRKAEQVRVV